MFDPNQGRQIQEFGISRQGRPVFLPLRHRQTSKHVKRACVQLFRSDKVFDHSGKEQVCSLVIPNTFDNSRDWPFRYELYGRTAVRVSSGYTEHVVSSTDILGSLPKYLVSDKIHELNALEVLYKSFVGVSL